jgi:aspartate 1-decarboxylase
MIEILKAKLQKVTVTQSNYKYKGSITICKELMKKLDILPYEKCIINGKTSRNDITYVLPGDTKGIIGINGALSTKHKKGDDIHVLFFDTMSRKKVLRLMKRNNRSLFRKPFPKIVETKECNVFDKYTKLKHEL